MRHRVTAGLVGAVMAGSVALAPVATAQNIGTEGCTPGYWKNHTSSWEGTVYRPNRIVEAVFDLPPELAAYGNVTLLQALSLRGGNDVHGAAEILLRAATAAVLNAAHEGLGYPYRRFTQFKIIETVNIALASGDRAQMLSLAETLDAANNLGCPLS